MRLKELSTTDVAPLVTGLKTGKPPKSVMEGKIADGEQARHRIRACSSVCLSATYQWSPIGHRSIINFQHR
jgi:hypothetical protein